jgi:putative membrane-bound dehydrogenase-like protein
MPLLRWIAATLLLGCGLPLAAAQSVPHGLRVPPGFQVTEFAGSDLANDIYSLTLDPRGRVVVAGRGYIRILIDDDNDGRADRAVTFADGPKDGAQGLFWEGTALYCTGDGGLRRYRDADGDGRADGPSELLHPFKTGGEHDAHDIKRGPDGWLYVLCGNSTGIRKEFATLPTSPVRDPVAGGVVRFPPDFRGAEIVAHGFRNPYRMDFNADGELFTFDSDNERCVSLPWYEGTRLYHVVPGGHHGWLAPQRAAWWRLPPYFCDVIAPVADLGRGSPTGVACYRHTQFPAKYHGGLFLLDWTFGKIWFVALRRSGSTYTGTPEVFAEAVGDNGFAPTDLAVHPDTGDLFVSIGGRGTRGAVYRIRYPAGRKAAAAFTPAPDPPQRLRELVELHRHRGERPAEEIVRAVQANWDQPDRYLRKAAADLVASLDGAAQRRLAETARTAWEKVTCYLGIRDRDPGTVVAGAGRLLLAPDSTPEVRLACVRLLQLAAGDLVARSAADHVFAGYSPQRADRAREHGRAILAIVRSAFPSGRPDLDRELSRCLAVFEDDDWLSLRKVDDRITPSSDPVDDIHYLIVSSRLRGPRDGQLVCHCADALLALDDKLARRGRKRDRNWAFRIAELHAELARKIPQLNGVLLGHPFFGSPDHVLFTRCPGFDRGRAAQKFVARAATDENYPWNPELVELLAELPGERPTALLQRLWERGGLEEALLAVLARRPRVEDRDKFVQGLRSPQVATVRTCLDALDRLPDQRHGAEVLALVRTLRGLSEGKAENDLRQRLGRRLERVTGQKGLAADKEAWTDWFRRAYPDLAARLGGADGVDVAAWSRRLAGLDWAAGNAERGLHVYSRAGCVNCHSGAQALGPDLNGVAGRFSRDDLFTAILQPSKDISPRYRTTLIETTSGQIYQGLIIYEAVDGLLLQTGPATTVRLGGGQIAGRRITDVSLMPAGLLDKLSDREIADLYAYLKSLRG